MKSDITALSAVVHVATIVGVIVTLMANTVSPVPAMDHWPMGAALGTTTALLIVGVNSVLTLFNYCN